MADVARHDPYYARPGDLRRSIDGQLKFTLDHLIYFFLWMEMLVGAFFGACKHAEGTGSLEGDGALAIKTLEQKLVLGRIIKRTGEVCTHDPDSQGPVSIRRP
jgi:hypothetical protein